MFTVAESRVAVMAMRATHQQEKKPNHRNKQRQIPEVKSSIEEDAEDAWALKAEEGRGDRRNVQGELQASDEP